MPSSKELVNYLHFDYSKHYLSINPLVKVPAKVIALQMSLDIAEILTEALVSKGYVKHAKLLDDWIKTIDQRIEETLESPITTSSNTEGVSWVCAKDPADTYYRIISKHIGKEIGKCTGVGMIDVLREEPGCTFEEITKEEFEKEVE